MCPCHYLVIFIGAILISTVVYRLLSRKPKDFVEPRNLGGLPIPEETIVLEGFTPPPIIVEPLPETIIVPENLSATVTEKPKAVRKPKRVLPKEEKDVFEGTPKKPTKARKPKNS